ncbi:carbohydrate ABC transporter substrate-binding protein, CUT1 family (TC 3.A.1.1.-) [Gracilibacillus orientalis]|uniref:Carbohydrate ABC transporter substrate-binding protein, CUT1 family (TC 3.A.1.1.-) n=1 Tax=Gracilibacillus orientalis TaxID=334253 RepID=A0A1I4NNW7_9BACI|nr:sugar ABC transporter substrate-binding protein [Gracilibacillus orientalis]SFM17191.1 carbohydrate ABC transporter substrate-binding protein, CUT1 family (TC 3.A.1.1.-) [Gracilibacillus orientalis]
MKKIISGFISVLAFMLLFACSNESATENGNDNDGSSNTIDLEQFDEFDWKRFDGEEIEIMLNQHPYAEAIIERIPEFEEKTGITVNHSLTPEENYFDKLTTSLNAQNGNPDVFMTGAYQVWEYATADYMQELDVFVEDENRTSPDYDVDDFYEGILDAGRWDGVPGHTVGEGNLYTVPLAYEFNLLHYNKRALESIGLEEPPETMEELIEVGAQLDGWNGEGSYGVGTRGTRSWATIHPGYMTSFDNHGAVDFTVEDGSLVSHLNSTEAIEITEKFAELVNEAGPSDWSSYTWYQVSNDLAQGKAAFTYDASNWAIFHNVPGEAPEAGNIGVTTPPRTKDDDLGTNMWVWSIAMNKSSEKKDAAWLFMQYFTGKEHMQWGAIEANVVDPVRESVFESDEYQERIGDIEGYVETFNELIDGSTIKFTPQPEFFNTTTEWAAALQDIVNGADAEERMNELNKDIQERVSRVRAE